MSKMVEEKIKRRGEMKHENFGCMLRRENVLVRKYGKLPEEWKTFMEKAFKECFRVLKNDGVLVFKWNCEQIPFAEVIKLSPYKPIFGDKRAKTRWTVFVKNSSLKTGEN